MLFMILSICVLIASAVIVALCYNYDYKPFFGNLGVQVVSTLILFVFIVVTIVASSILIYVKSTENYKYEVMLENKRSLEYRLDMMSNDENASVVEINSLYNDIYEYNMGIKSYKYWGNNLWFNWFYNSKIVEYGEYIEIKGD